MQIAPGEQPGVVTIVEHNTDGIIADLLEPQNADSRRAGDELALLEAADTKARAELLIGLLEMAVRANAGPPTQLN